MEGKQFGEVAVTFAKKGCVRGGIFGHTLNASDAWRLKLSWDVFLHRGGWDDSIGRSIRDRNDVIIRVGAEILTETNI